MSNPEPAGSLVQLIKAARAGSREALGELLENHRHYLLWLARETLPRRVRSKEASSDVVQQTCLEAQVGFAQFTGCSQEEWVAWLRQILLHNVANARRCYEQTGKRDVQRETANVAANSESWQLNAARPVATPSAHVMFGENEQSAYRVLGELPEEYGQVIILHHRDGLSFEDIGACMGRSEASVRKLWLRAVKRLQQRL